MFTGSDSKRLVAHFPRTISVYEGSEVRVLGVPDRQRRDGRAVGHRRRGDDDLRQPTSKLPADAKAAIVAPSIVGDRFVQLTPVYTGRRGAGRQRRARRRADRGPDRARPDLREPRHLNVALGPNGANRNGALSDLLAVTADNFDGQGAQLPLDARATSPGSPPPWTTTRRSCSAAPSELGKFVSTLAENDQTVRSFNQSLVRRLRPARGGEGGAVRLAAQPGGRADRGVVVRQGQPRDPRPQHLRASTGSPRCWSSSATPSTRSSRSRPLALNNLALTYNPQAGTLDTRANIGELVNQVSADPATYLCGLDQPGQGRRGVCDTIKQVLPRAGALPPGAAAGPPGPAVRPDARRTRGGVAMKRLRAARAARRDRADPVGCDFDVYKLPLPGGPDVGDDPMTVTVLLPRRARPGAPVDGQGQRRHASGR